MGESAKRTPEGPLTPAVFHILVALADGARHGYAIMQAVERTGGPGLATGPGTIYGSLARMERAGLVEEVPRSEVEEDPDEPRRGRPRKYFRITETGRGALEAEARRLNRLADLVSERRLLPDEAGS